MYNSLNCSNNKPINKQIIDEYKKEICILNILDKIEDE